MPKTTSVEGYPYPLEPDFADVQDAFRLATAIDADLRAEQAPFRSFMARPSFIGRQTSNGSTFVTGTDSVIMQAIDWDNTGGITVPATSWLQPFVQPPSWWLFGATLLVNNAAAGTPGELVEGFISVTTADQVTGVQTTTPWYQRNDESNTGGEWLNIFAMSAVYQASVSLTLNVSGTTAKGVALGSRLWGMYLGPVT